MRVFFRGFLTIFLLTTLFGVDGQEPTDCMYNVLRNSGIVGATTAYQIFKKAHLDEAMLSILSYNDADRLLLGNGLSSAAVRFDILLCVSSEYKNSVYSPVSCHSNQGPCKHGVCRLNRTIEQYTCRCNHGYKGKACEEELNECSLRRPCKNGGTCEDRVNNYTCHCAPGYFGKHCETDHNECASGPCYHGNCTDVINGYRCECQAGFTGVLCQTNIDECSSDPCQHGGRCQDGVNAFSCVCQPGYTGPRCEENINECSSSPCKHMATCKDGVNSYMCLCLHGYKGEHCEIEWLNETVFLNLVQLNNDQSNEGPTYIRWGRSDCPSTSTLIYGGSVAGSYYSHSGGGSNPLCLPNTPQYGRYSDFASGSPIYGAEYQIQNYHHNQPFNYYSYINRDIPCAVCTTRGKRSLFMLPAGSQCPSGWVREYHGYLMSSYYSGHYRTEHVCVDSGSSTIPGRDGQTTGMYFYHVSVDCGYGIPCGPYVDARELTCAICSQ